MSFNRVCKTSVTALAAILAMWVFVPLAGAQNETAAPDAAAAQEEAVHSLAAADAQDLIGLWSLKMDFQGTPVDMTADFKDVDGKTMCVVTSAIQPGALEITNIKRDGAKLQMKHTLALGEGDQAQEFKLTIDMEINGDTATGHVADESGLIDASISGGRGGAAEAGPASELDVASVQDWLGTWTLNMEFQGTPVAMTLDLRDVGGKLGASLTSARRPEPTAITDIAKSEEGLTLKYGIEFGGNPVDLTMDLQLKDGKLSGTLGDSSGMMSAELDGAKAEGDAPADAATEVSSLDASDAEDFIGDWAVSMDFQGNPVPFDLSIKDVDGKVAASVTTPQSPDPISITDIAKSADGLDLKYQVDFGGNTVDLTMALKVADAKLSGTLSDSNGLFNAALEGEKAEGEGDQGGEPIRISSDDASDLATADAKDFVANWKLAMELRGNPMEMTLIMQDVEGKIGAMLSNPFGAPAFIEEIEKTEEGIKMLYEAQFGPQRLDINITAKIDGEQLAGTFADAGGLISAEFVGTKISDDDAQRAARRSQRGGRRGGRGGDSGNTEIKIEGQEISIAFASLRTNSDDYKALQETADGAVWKFTQGRASKMLSEVDMQFGDTIVKKGNVHETYPGVYSLWLKKVGGGWHLVFNEHADIWGTQHDPSVDVAEIPLVVSKAESPQETFNIELTEEGNGGTLKLAWGEDVWTAKFTVPQP